MPTELQAFVPAAPEIFILMMTCGILIVDVFFTGKYRELSYRLSQLTVMGGAILVVALFPEEPEVSFNNTFVSDSMSAVLKVVALVVAYFAFAFSKNYLQERELFKGEYYVLGLFAVLGTMVLVSARSLLTVYLGLELLSLSLYAMVALHRDSRTASEAAMKYFVLGALASGMLLYGMSMLYGVTGTLDLSDISQFISGQSEASIILVFALVFVLVGVAFKLGAVPFHMWVPDVYEGAPTPVTMFIGTAPKLAAFGMLVRLLADGLSGLQGEWSQMLIILAVLSMALGNIIAIAQRNLKRMLAYSTIAHTGFLFLGMIAGTKDGYAASMFYAIVYALMAMGGFGMIILLSRAGYEADQLSDFRGLNQKSSWLAFLTLILMLSMAGLPPFLGFWAKWSVLRAVIDVEMTWLAVVAVAFAIVGLFYYLRIVRLMYFDEPDERMAIDTTGGLRLMISVNALAILGLGVYPGALMALCLTAFTA